MKINNICATDVVHYFSIKVYDSKRNLIEFKIYDNMLWTVRLKWDWYFKYRAALFQVNYPKYKVEVSWGNLPAVGNSLEQIKKNKLIAKKRKISTYQNKLLAYQNNWNSIFPIEEDILFIKAKNKIDTLKKEIQNY
jgi:hypothetical protein